MNHASLSAEELIAWNDQTAKNWRTLAGENPALLDVPCDISKAKTVGELLQHVVAVELRYAERLSNLPVTDYAQLPFSTAHEIFATHDRALEVLRGLLADLAFDWSEEIEFNTLTAGRLRAPRKAVLHHSLLHALRHYAQLSTLARQHGFGPVPPADYLFLVAKRA
ncbi:DinB family protein [Terriglobus saanensis]|uniref:DinB family protein n=1 Tax=Terriglobus saanensis (strain ATCC BAA-1853 / DSM 23119 / SP1PR4) TaxID=401053 RepID=E8UXL1_TERSS|nr:DinB family protein [Terriglobus saanensis]ADV81955.1 DinB family protein [Terriglobus saanensis SP1PR4]